MYVPKCPSVPAFGVILALTVCESFFFDFCVSDFIVQMIITAIGKISTNYICVST